MVLDAFRDAFGDREDVHLTIKAHYNSTVRGPNNAHPDKAYKNVSVINSELDTDALVDLVHRHHVMVYPSYGEGFGFIPLQAMATGMPTICTEAWAPYKRFLPEELRLNSFLAASPWEHIHPGKMFHPDHKDLVEKMKYADENFNRLAATAFALAPRIHKEYSWDRLTENAFSHIVEKFG
jgi:glycosyltransferase involved in cell wall biosynthesis